MTTALAATLVGYARRSYADCQPTGAPNYLCSGVTLAGQYINASSATLTADNTFAINSATYGLSVTGDGMITFNDPYYLNVNAAAGNGLTFFSTADNGNGPGGLNITAGGLIVSSATAVQASTGAVTGAVDITLSGNFQSGGNAIDVGATGSSLTLETFGTIASNWHGIALTSNYVTGATTLTSYSDILSVQNGIHFAGYNNNFNVQITSDGDITSTGGAGIFARPRDFGALNMTIDTTAGHTINAFNGGIDARNYYGAPYGLLTINSGSDINTTYGVGITARHNGDIVINATGDIYGYKAMGIYEAS